MKQLILTTIVLLLFGSCAVTKQKQLNNKSDNISYQQQPNENVSQTATTEPIQTKGYIVNKDALLEKLWSEIGPKTDDYNQYQYDREIYLYRYLDNIIGYENNDCDMAKELIKEFCAIDKKEQNGKPVHLMDIAFFRCQESYDFLVSLIKNNSSEADRCNAIRYLSWSLDSDYLSYILEYAKKDSLSVEEKLALAQAYTIFGIFTSHSYLKEEAIKLLDEICYNSSLYSDLEGDCAWTYYRLGGKPAINYHIALLERREGFRRVGMAVVMAELGEYETTFPMFVEAIRSDTINDILAAIGGLRVIGTEEAIRLIEEQAQNKNESVVKKVQETLKILDKIRRKK